MPTKSRTPSADVAYSANDYVLAERALDQPHWPAQVSVLAIS
jgi:hypothetical protein